MLPACSKVNNAIDYSFIPVEAEGEYLRLHNCNTARHWRRIQSRYKQGNRRSHFARAVHSHHPFPADPFCSEHVTMHCQCGSPKTARYPWDFVTLPEEDRATAIGNMHKNGKDRECGSGDILADRQTHRQTDRRAHHNTSPQLPRAK